MRQVERGNLSILAVLSLLALLTTACGGSSSGRTHPPPPRNPWVHLDHHPGRLHPRCDDAIRAGCEVGSAESVAGYHKGRTALKKTNDSYCVVFQGKRISERYYRDKAGWVKVSARDRLFRMTAEQVLNHLLPALAFGEKLGLTVKVEHHEAIYWETLTQENVDPVGG